MQAPLAIMSSPPKPALATSMAGVFNESPAPKTPAMLSAPGTPRPPTQALWASPAGVEGTICAATPSTSASSRSETSGPTCTKCEQPMGDEQNKGSAKRPEHKSCNNNYKCLARRWKKEPAVKMWWDSLGHQGQTSWYSRHRSVEAPHSQAKALDVKSTISEEKSAGNKISELDTYITFEEWMVPRLLLSGSDAAGLRKVKDEWNALLQSNHPKIFHRGQWLVYKFGGIVKESYRDEALKSAKIATTHIQSAPDLAKATKDASGLLAQHCRGLAGIAAALAASATSMEMEWQTDNVHGEVKVTTLESGSGGGYVDNELFEVIRQADDLERAQRDLELEMQLDVPRAPHYIYLGGTGVVERRDVRLPIAP